MMGLVSYHLAEKAGENNSAYLESYFGLKFLGCLCLLGFRLDWMLNSFKELEV